MPDIAAMLQHGATNLWLFIPTAIALGALHGLEPGHSKTMMAAFIVAIRGTVTQAVLLGLSATLSHTAIVWLIALLGLHYGSQWNMETNEPYFQLASAVVILCIAVWMMWRTGKHKRDHDRAHHHDHHHHDHDGHDHHHHDHGHNHHDHGHANPMDEGKFENLISAEYQDPHELAHANEIRTRFADRSVTTGQVILFGLTGGLIPCPASVTILLLCLQLKKVTLGALLVLCFSIGLALTLVVSGVVAAISVHQVSKRWSGFNGLAEKAPYFSGSVIILIGLYIGYSGLKALL